MHLMQLDENMKEIAHLFKWYTTLRVNFMRTNIECDNFRVYTRLPSSDSNHRISTFMSGSLKPVLKFNRGGGVSASRHFRKYRCYGDGSTLTSAVKKKKWTSTLQSFPFTALFYLTLRTTWIFVGPPAPLQSCRKGKLHGVCQHSHSR